MTFKDVASTIGKVAPLVAGLLGGPVGAGVALGAKLLGSLFSAEPEPEALMTAIKADPEALVKIRGLELEHQRELVRYSLEAETNQMAQETLQIQAVNMTMQAETKSEHWVQYSWRPFIGFCTGIAFIILVCLVGWLAYEAILMASPSAIAMIPQVIMAFTGLFAIPGAILGVSAWHRGQLKREAANHEPENLEEKKKIASNILSKLGNMVNEVDRP